MGHVNTGPSIQDLELFEYQRGGYSMADPMTLLQQQNGAVQGATSVQSPQIVQMPVPPINPIPQQAPQVQNVAENIPVPPVIPSIVQKQVNPGPASEVHEVTTEDQKQIVQQNAAAFAVPPGTEVKNLKSQTDVNNLARQVGEQKQEEMKMSNDKERFVEAISEYVNDISDEEFLELSNDFKEGKNAGSFKKFWKKWGNKILIATGAVAVAGVGYKVITSHSGSSDDIDEEDTEELVSCLSALFA